MLQQTRVETVIPYYERWMKRFPTVATLATASTQEVLAVWEGLGYYSRARNLQRAAQILIRDWGGELPRDPKALRKLPGIGRYTAGAIASIAFCSDEPALDGNIRRVLARLYNVTEPARSPAGERRLWQLVRENLPIGQAGDFNQALMDLASAVCTPRSPACQDCPISSFCKARALGVQEARPVSLAKPAIPHYTVAAAVIAHEGQVLIAQRPPKGLLGGLWEFPGGKQQAGESLETCLQREIKEELGADIHILTPLGVYRHAYTHFRLTLYAFCCNLDNSSQPSALEVHDLRWTTIQDLPSYPMGKVDRMISQDLLLRGNLLC
jgi:A/G-specific adenine glycosylase